jgi:hypothetical protein
VIGRRREREREIRKEKVDGWPGGYGCVGHILASGKEAEEVYIRHVHAWKTLRFIKR